MGGRHEDPREVLSMSHMCVGQLYIENIIKYTQRYDIQILTHWRSPRMTFSALKNKLRVTKLLHLGVP